MAPTSRPNLSRHDSMQEYMLLSAQKEALQRRIALEIPFAIPITTESPAFQSLSSSPTSPDHAPLDPHPTTGPSSPPSPSTTAAEEEAAKLAHLNHQIVATLTELLNTESVRADEKSHRWIQERLMELEQQIRRERRRRSSHTERAFVCALAQGFTAGVGT